MRFIKWRLPLVIVFFGVLKVWSQDQGKPMPLKTILLEFEQQYQIKFNFIEEEIALHTVKWPVPKRTLEEKLDYLQTETNLRFKFINNELIAISNNKKLDKPLCGYLIDSQSKVPINNATILISGTNFYALSNDDGFFQLPVFSPNPIKISHVNYQTLSITVDKIYTESCPTFSLDYHIQELEEVIAQLFLTTGISRKNDGTIEIQPKKFGILPGLVEADVLQTMQQIPGIISTDETIANLNIRGGTHDQNLFLWNGIRLYQTGHFFGLISALNPNLAHKITIAKNGSSAFYGESVSGVVDISSRTNLADETTSTVGVNMLNAEFVTKVKTGENSRFEISGRRSFTDVIATPTYKNYFNRIFQNTEVVDLSTNENISFNSSEDFYFYDFTMQYHQKIGKKNELYINGIAIANELSFKENKIAGSETLSKENELNQRTLGGNLAWKTNWNAKNHSELSVYSSFYRLDAENQSVNNNQVLVQENTLFDNGIRLTNAHQLTAHWNFKNGYQYNEIGIQSLDEINQPQFKRSVKDVLRNHALFVEWEYQSKNEKFYTRFGGRANYFEKWALFRVEPRFFTKYALNEFLKIEFSGEQKSQTISQIIDLQQDFFGVEKRRWVLANNTTIPIQKSNQLSLGFHFRKNNWYIQPEVFYKNVTGITSAGQGFQNQLEFVKVIGEYEVYGLELLIQKQIKNVTSWMNYSYNHNEYTFDGYIPPQFANNFEVNHSIGLGTTYEWNRLKIAIGARWFTGRPNTIPLSSEPVFNTPNNPEIAYNLPNADNLDDYFQMNFSSSYSINMGKKTNLLMGISVLNLLNQRNTINRFYRLNATNTGIEEVNTYSLELTPNAFLKVNF